MKVSDLFEADDPKRKRDEDDDKKKSKPTQDKPKVDPGGMFDKKQDRPLTRKERDEQEFGKESRKERKLRLAAKAETERAARGVNLDAKSMKHLDDLHKNMPAGDDDETEPKPPSDELVVRKASDVPKVISSAMVAAGFVDPDFHLVSNLPGNMSRAIKQLGKALFGAFTKTPTESISMIGNLSGMGPNSPKEVNSVASYLKKHGEDLGPGDIDFEPVMPGYKAKIHNFTADGMHFMMVKDHMGDYIYAWPSADTKEGSATGRVGHDQKKLR